MRDNRPFSVTHCDGRRSNIASEKVGQRAGRIRPSTGPGPWPLRSIELETAQRSAVVIFVHVGIAEFATKAERVPALGPRQDVGNVTSDVLAAFRWGDADLVKARDLNVGSAWNRIPVDQRIGAQKQAEV